METIVYFQALRLTTSSLMLNVKEQWVYMYLNYERFLTLQTKFLRKSIKITDSKVCSKIFIILNKLFSFLHSTVTNCFFFLYFRFHYNLVFLLFNLFPLQFSFFMCMCLCRLYLNFYSNLFSAKCRLVFFSFLPYLLKSQQ